jgi:homoserine kinase
VQPVVHAGGDQRVVLQLQPEREPYRARLFPHLAAMRDAARSAGAIGACLSGAGPTVLAFVPPAHVPAVMDACDATARRLGVPGRVEALAPVTTGATLVAEQVVV